MQSAECAEDITSTLVPVAKEAIYSCGRPLQKTGHGEQATSGELPFCIE